MMSQYAPVRIDSRRLAGKSLSLDASRMSIWYVSPRIRKSFLRKSSEVGLYSSTNPSRRYLLRMEVLPTRGAPRTTMRLQFCGLVECSGSCRCSWTIWRCRLWPCRTRAARWSSGDLLQVWLLLAVLSCLTAAPERVFLSCFHWDVATLSIPNPALIPDELRCCDAFLYASKTLEDPAHCPSLFPWNWGPSGLEQPSCGMEVRMEVLCAPVDISIVLGWCRATKWAETVIWRFIGPLELVFGAAADVSCLYIGCLQPRGSSASYWLAGFCLILQENTVFWENIM